MSERYGISVPSRESQVYPCKEDNKDEGTSRPSLRTRRQKAKAYTRYFLKNTKILFVCIILYAAIVAAATYTIFSLADGYEEESKHMVRTGVSAQVEYRSLIGMAEIATKLTALSLIVRGVSNCTGIVSAFAGIAEAALADGSDNIVRLYFDAAGQTAASYPEVVYDGRYLTNHSFIAAGDTEYLAVMQRRGVTMGLPFDHTDGYLASYMYYPLWVAAAYSDSSTGCESYYNCSIDNCWDTVSNMKFVGTLRALVNLDAIIGHYSSQFRSLASNHDYCFYARHDHAIDAFVMLHCSNDRPRQTVSTRFDMFDVRFRLDVANHNGWSEQLNDSWAPEWKYQLSLSVYAFLLPFMVLLYWALVSQKKYSKLLSAILPQRVIDHLAFHTDVFSEEFNDVTILFSDICNFTPIASSLTPFQIVGMLDDLYSIYDELAKKHGVYKVETIGDAYMVSCGCPDAVDPQVAALRMIAMAKDMIKAASTFRPSYLPRDIPFRIRVGINSGGVVAGVVGRTMPRYCLFGDVVNTASRMESTCDPMKIQISESTFNLIKGCGVALTARGFVAVKGKGSMKTYYVDLDVLPAEEAMVATPPLTTQLNRNVAFSWIPRSSAWSDGDDSASLSGLWTTLTTRGKSRTLSSPQQSPSGNESPMRQGFRSLDFPFPAIGMIPSLVPPTEVIKCLSLDQMESQPSALSVSNISGFQSTTDSPPVESCSDLEYLNRIEV